MNENLNSFLHAHKNIQIKFVGGYIFFRIKNNALGVAFPAQVRGRHVREFTYKEKRLAIFSMKQ